jgi:transcription elongation factor GreA
MVRTMLTARPPSRPIDDRLMTREGYDRLQRELLELTTEGRRELAERVSRAREAEADVAENGELREALDESALLEQRIAELTSLLAGVRIVESAAGDGAAAVGTRVGVRTGDGEVLHYELVGAGEADPARGRISISSPVGEAIAGRVPGDRIEVETPRRRIGFELVSVTACA